MKITLMIMVRPQWRDLTSGGSWTYMPSISTHYYSRLVALSSTEAYMVAVIIIVMIIIIIIIGIIITCILIITGILIMVTVIVVINKVLQALH